MTQTRGVQTGKRDRQDGSVINEADFLTRGTNGFNETQVAQKTTQIALNNNLSLSSFRDIQVGNVSKEGSEYRVRADGYNNTSILRTALRGNYISGHVLTAGLGVRVPTLPTGDQFVEWGYYDYNGSNNPRNGITFKRVEGNVLLNLYKDGTNQLGGGSGVPQSEWNVDPLDGTGPSGVNLEVPNGYVYRMPFIYYGYGPVDFYVGFRDSQGVWREYPVHEADIDEGTSIEEPNLPLTVTTYNGGDTSTYDAFVGGRQISVSGPDKALEPREVGWEIEDKSIDTGLTPLITFQQKPNRENIRVKIKDFQFEADVDCWIYLYRNITLSEGTTTFSTPTDYDPNETATQWNIEATAFTGGTRFGGTKSVFVGQTGNSSGASSGDLPKSVLIENETWSVVARAKTTAGQISGYVNVDEEW